MDLEQMVATMPFAVAVGVQLDAATAEQVRGRLPFDPQRCTIGGILHGGALMTLADALGAICAFLNLPQGASTSTIESKTNFFRGVSAGEVQATSRPLHVGRRTIVVENDLRDDQGRRVALTVQTQAVLLG